MMTTNPPSDDRESQHPDPGAETNVDERAIPPYDDRSTGDAEVAAGVPRAMGSEEPLEEPVQPGPDGPQDGEEGQPPPAGVGESISRGGEDIQDREGKEAGRFDTGTDDSPADRPTGEADQRDQTGV